MATHAGSEGIVKIGDARIAEVKSWNIDEVCDTVDASIIGTSWRKNMATIRSWSGSLDAFWDESDEGGQNNLRLGGIVEMKLYAAGEDDGSKYFTGTAIVTGISRQASFDGLVESSFTFQGNGELRELIHQIAQIVPQQNVQPILPQVQGEGPQAEGQQVEGDGEVVDEVVDDDQ